MIVEDFYYHGRVVEEDVEDYGRDPDEHGAEQGRHPKDCLEVQAPHHELQES